jgi:RNA polymerase sigma-70 factor (ECF subfamily)
MTAMCEVSQEDNLVLKAKNGDRKAFSDLALVYGGQAFAAAFAILRNREDAEDAVQNAFVKAFQKLGQLKDDSSFPGWLRSIVRQECFGLQRTYKRKLLHLTSMAEDILSKDFHFIDAKQSKKIYQQEIWDHCLAGLTDRAREIVTLHYVEGFSCEGIAGLMAISDGSVKSHLFKARKKIESRLKRIGIYSLDDL